MKLGTKVLAMVFAPALATATTLGLGAFLAPPAGASTTTANSNASITFTDTNGVSQTCTVYDYASHTNDDPNQPSTQVVSGMGGSGSGCFEFTMTIFVRYDDRNGVTRTARFSSLSTGDAQVEGTFSHISTSVSARFFNCSTQNGQRCDVIAIAAPK
jgi:hypothetical protein